MLDAKHRRAAVESYLWISHGQCTHDLTRALVTYKDLHKIKTRENPHIDGETEA